MTERAHMFATQGFTIPTSTNGCPTTDQVRIESRHFAADVPPDIEAALVAVLARRLVAGESYRAAGDHREYALREMFAQLSAAQALTVERRLDSDQAFDPLAVAFRRLTGERRLRLRAHLAQARRRLARTSANTSDPDRPGSERDA